MEQTQRIGLVTGLATALWMLVAVRLISGAMQANAAVAQAYVADISAPEERAKRFGMLGAMFGMGFVLGPVIGGLLGAIDLHLPFFVAGGLAVLLGILLWLLREPLVTLSTTDPAVQAVALGLVLYLCFYQGFDGLQTVAAHALRGYKVTLLPMVLHTVCFWGIGLSGGYWLSFHAPWRAGAPSVAGFWEGCVVATVAATLLFGALLRRVSRDRL